MALAGAAVAAAAALVVTTSGPPGGGPQPEAGAPATAFSESRILLAAASDVEKTKATSGAYWYQEEPTGSLQKVPGKDYMLDVRNETKSWLAKGAGKRDRRWTLHIDAGARPATPADEEAWRADGSPKRWDLTDYDQARRDLNQRGSDDTPPDPQPEIATWDGKGEFAGDAPGGGADTVPSGAEINLTELQPLPTDPERLRGWSGSSTSSTTRRSTSCRGCSATRPRTLPSSCRCPRSCGPRPTGYAAGRAGHRGGHRPVRAPGLRRGDQESAARSGQQDPLDLRQGDRTAAVGRAVRDLEPRRTPAWRAHRLHHLTAMRWTDQAPPFDHDFMAGEPETPNVETDGKPTGKR